MSARKFGGAAVVAFPLTILAGDFFRIRGEAGSTGDGSIVSKLAAVDAPRGLFESRHGSSTPQRC